MNDLASTTFSPKELADVIGVSQSSIKRWVDAGRIPVTRTAGGHRRISRNAALQFIRSNRMRIVRPDLLGIADLRETDQPIESASLSGEFLHSLIMAGRPEQVRRVVTAAYLGGASIAEIFDGPIRDMLDRVGRLWQTDQRGIAIEHAATSAVIESISQIAALLEQPAADAPVALGGAPAEDPHVIPSLMTSTLLRSTGWRTINLGPNTPAHAFSDAVRLHDPALLWLAAKSRMSASDFNDLCRLAENLVEEDIQIVVGGDEACRHRDKWPQAVTVLQTMTELEETLSSKAGEISDE